MHDSISVMKQSFQYGASYISKSNKFQDPPNFHIRHEISNFR